MAYQKTTVTGYGTRLQRSLKGILTGIVLFIIGTGLLWWNEGRTVKSSNANEEAYEATVVANSISAIDPALNGKMVLAHGFATTQDSLVDNYFKVGVNAIKLIRSVEYYQWVEHEKKESRDKLGGSEETVTTYYYKQEWVSSPKNSSDFEDPSYKNKNFTVSNIESETMIAQNVAFGAYRLPNFLVERIGGDQPFNADFSKVTIQSLNSSVKQILKERSVNYNPNGEYVHVSGNEMYLGADADRPAIGDVRITFSKVMPAEVTVWAKVIGNTFEEYNSENGYSVSVLSMGTKSLENVYQREQEMNSKKGWLLRLLGFFLVIGGLYGMFSILVTLLKLIPALSNIMDVGVKVVCGIVALIWSLLVIAVAWVFYRPILAVTLLVVVGALIFYLIRRSKASKSEEVTTM